MSPTAPPCGAEGPVFREPWEAQAFALVVALHERGLFTWPQWAACLSETLAQAEAGGEVGAGEDYYRHWLTALERLVVSRGLVPPLSLGAMRQAWRTASELAPHGEAPRLPGGVRALGKA
ncbi:MAG: nitrile hydratase accessory protein [Betaproteobacteria bacterium]|nr:nitrile hydratase accessory protein [Betaproteobacteria bacterium]